MKIKRIVF